ncbi:MAG: prolipoprotein diacylglyceryl transferase [Bacteroidetes bacterium]|nr:prolipoprotein diacylglyceryl transferase [Bacteroidota bacterium]
MKGYEQKDSHADKPRFLYSPFRIFDLKQVILSFHTDFPVYFQFGAVSLYLHTILESLSFLIGFRYYVWLRKQTPDQIPAINRIFILVGATAGALIFSRLVGAMEAPSRFFSGDEALGYYFVHKTIVGGLLGGLIGVELVKKMIGENSSSGDLFTYPIILALIIGRTGCFSMGIYEATFGSVTQSWAGMDLGDGLQRHPIMIYEMVFLLLLWLGIRFMEGSVLLEPGARFKFFMVAFLAFRFCIEFIKPGERIWAFTVIQLCCAAGLLYYYKVWTKPGKLILHEKSK